MATMPMSIYYYVKWCIILRDLQMLRTSIHFKNNGSEIVRYIFRDYEIKGQKTVRRWGRRWQYFQTIIQGLPHKHCLHHVRLCGNWKYYVYVHTYVIHTNVYVCLCVFVRCSHLYVLTGRRTRITYYNIYNNIIYGSTDCVCRISISIVQLCGRRATRIGT